jgi:hypothetical protein
MVGLSGRKRRREPRQQLSRIFLLLSIQPIRKAVLQYISAYDAAKLALLHLLCLTSWERERYLKPIRDLVWDTEELEMLSREGMSLVLLGSAVHVLGQRLNQTRQYEATQGKRKLRVYLVGAFPILSRSPEILRRLINFSISGESSPGSHSTSSSKDEAEVMTSGTPGDHGEEDAADSSGDHSDDESRQKNHSYKRAEEPPRNKDGKMVCKYQICRGTFFDQKCEWRSVIPSPALRTISD